MKFKLFMLLAIILSASMLTGCSDFYQVPAGYVGKILTPTGWTAEIIEAGQVDLGTAGAANQQNVLVTLEATSVSIKETFEQTTGDNGRDNRIVLGGAPSTVDVYVRMRVPVSATARSGIFAQITPVPVDDQTRVSTITVDAIYSRLAKMDVRSAIRQVLSKYSSASEVIKNQETVNNELGLMVIKQFEKSSVPLELQNVVISNVQVDQTVLAAENAKQSALLEAEKIRTIGEAIRQNPQYLQAKKYETYREIASKGATIYIVDGAGNQGLVIPVK